MVCLFVAQVAKATLNSRDYKSSTRWITVGSINLIVLEDPGDNKVKGTIETRISGNGHLNSFFLGQRRALQLYGGE